MRLTRKMIRDKAYELWEADGRPTGAAEEHWFAAEILLSEVIDITLDRTCENGKRPLPIGLRRLNNP